MHPKEGTFKMRPKGMKRDRCVKKWWESIPRNYNVKFPKWKLIRTIIETERTPGCLGFNELEETSAKLESQHGPDYAEL